MRSASLNEVSEFVLDGTHSSPVRVDAGVPVLSAQNIRAGGLDYGTDRFTTDAEYRAFTRRLALRPNDLLLTIVGTIGRAALVTDVRPLVFQRSVAVIRPRPEVVDPRFLLHTTQSHDFRDQLRRFTNKSSQAGVYLGRLKEAIIHLPPLPEQKRIADIFDQADAVRAQRRVGVETLGALELSIFLEMSGDPATNPMGWPTAPLSSLVRPNDKINYGVVQPGEHVDDGVPVIRVGDLLGGRVVHDRLKRLDPRIEATYARSRLEGDEILVSCVGTIGVIALADESVKGFNIARAVARIPLDTGTDRVYLSAQLRTDAIQRYFISELRTVSQPTLNIKQLSEAIVMVPPLRLQATYGDRIRSLHAVRERQRASLVLLDNLFASLQHRAFRGEL